MQVWRGGLLPSSLGLHSRRRIGKAARGIGMFVCKAQQKITTFHKQRRYPRNIPTSMHTNTRLACISIHNAELTFNGEYEPSVHSSTWPNDVIYWSVLRDSPIPWYLLFHSPKIPESMARFLTLLAVLGTTLKAHATPTEAAATAKSSYCANVGDILLASNNC